MAPRDTRPSCQITGAIARMISPVARLTLSTVPPSAAKAIAVLVHDSDVRSLARPGSRSSGSSPAWSGPGVVIAGPT